MMKFTKEEASLCKQVAEKHRKKIELGDWFTSQISDAPFLCQYGYRERNVFIPLWTISDCLEFIEEKGFTYVLNFINREGSYEYGESRREHELTLYNNRTHETQLLIGKTCKIVALKAVLAMLENK